jgi:probable Rubsico expression protein CbbX
MWGIWRRYWITIVAFAVVAIGLVLAWVLAGGPLAGVLTAVALLFVPVILSTRDGWRQTHPANLTSRGITPEYGAKFDAMNAGLRRDMKGFVPTPVHRRLFGPDIIMPASASGGAGTGGSPATRPRPAQRPSASRNPKSGRSPKSSRSPQGRRGRQRAELLEPDATITLIEERQAAGIDDLFAALDSELVGLIGVKKKVEEIGSLLLVDRARQRFGLSASRPNLHMCFTGSPGTGKTTVALKMADLLHRLGYLEKGHLVHAMRDDLVAEYIGQTAPKTKAVLERAMGGVLFIDEAYSLYRADDSKDYGQECIEILLQVMENDRDKLVVILAGYKDRMDHFFESNPGMSSRIAHHLDFAEYDLDELLAIGQLMLDQSSYYLSDSAKTAFRDYLCGERHDPRFANARSVRNELERARLRHAYRLAADPERDRSRDDLMRLEAADFHVNSFTSRVANVKPL